MNQKKVKVHIVCDRCGEHFILRGREESNDRYYGTGFKRCICENDHDFSIYKESP
jgi:formylmethanofuran dehydrogenase subunit E